MPVSQNILYGDSATPLTDHDRGGDQQLASFPEIVGDAPAIGGDASGGADTLTAAAAGTPFLIGDALTISDPAKAATTSSSPPPPAAPFRSWPMATPRPSTAMPKAAMIGST